MNKDIDINDCSFTIGLESEVIERVRKGDITRLMMDIGEDNQEFLLENVDGHLILITEAPQQPITDATFTTMASSHTPLRVPCSSWFFQMGKITAWFVL